MSEHEMTNGDIWLAMLFAQRFATIHALSLSLGRMSPEVVEQWIGEAGHMPFSIDLGDGDLYRQTAVEAAARNWLIDIFRGAAEVAEQRRGDKLHS